MRIYSPAPTGSFPTLMSSHGSTGAGTDPARFTQPIDEQQLAQFFVYHGRVVVLPARRGRGNPEGVYDERFERDRTQGYTCDPPQSLAGAERALDDITAAINCRVPPELFAHPGILRPDDGFRPIGNLQFRKYV